MMLKARGHLTAFLASALTWLALSSEAVGVVSALAWLREICTQLQRESRGEEETVGRTWNDGNHLVERSYLLRALGPLIDSCRSHRCPICGPCGSWSHRPNEAGPTFLASLVQINIISDLLRQPLYRPIY